METLLQYFFWRKSQCFNDKKCFGFLSRNKLFFTINLLKFFSQWKLMTYFRVKIWRQFSPIIDENEILRWSCNGGWWKWNFDKGNFQNSILQNMFHFCFNSKQMDITAILYLLPSYNYVNSNDIYKTIKYCS